MTFSQNWNTPAEIPAQYFRTDTEYRSAWNGRQSALGSAGILRKPKGYDNLVNIVEKRYVVIYVIRGEGTYTDWNEKTYPMLPGSVVQRIPGRIHSTVQLPDDLWCEAFVSFSREFYEVLSSSCSIDPERPVFQVGLHLSILEQFRTILNRMHEGPGRDAETLLLAHQLILELYRRERELRSSPHAGLMEQARVLLEHSVDSESETPLQTLAASMGMSYERFRKIFRDETGISPHAYRIRRRIEAACRLLSEHRCSVKEIAANLGYPDVQSFSKQFKKLQGMTPSDFLRNS